MKGRALGGVLAGLLVLALSAAPAAAQEDPSDRPLPEVTVSVEDAGDVSSPMAGPVIDTSSDPAPAVLFVRLIEPAGADDDIDVPVTQTHIVIRGQTLPGAVVSVAGLFTDVDEQGYFSDTLELEPGINDIDVIASTPDGALADTSVFVFRGD